MDGLAKLGLLEVVQASQGCAARRGHLCSQVSGRGLAFKGEACSAQYGLEGELFRCFLGETLFQARLSERLKERYSIGVITNDIYTSEDAEYLMRAQALPLERIRGVETGGCPHTAIREDASINLAAVADLRKEFEELDVIFIESGGDNLAATFSPELADLTLYVIDTAAGQDIPRKKGPGVTRSDMLIVNKVDLAPHVGVDRGLLESDTKAARGARPFVLAELKHGRGVQDIVDFLVHEGGL